MLQFRVYDGAQREAATIASSSRFVTRIECEKELKIVYAEGVTQVLLSYTLRQSTFNKRAVRAIFAGIPEGVRQLL